MGYTTNFTGEFRLDRPLEYLVEHFLKPWGYELSGSVIWYGEEPGDSGVLYAKGHRIKAVPDEVLRKEPDWDE